MADKLKPCPCCGNKNIRIIVYPEQENETYVYFSDRFAVQCEYTGEGIGCGMESGHYKYEEDAVECWNKRAGQGGEKILQSASPTNKQSKKCHHHNIVKDNPVVGTNSCLNCGEQV